MRQTISFYASRDATADYRAHKQQNCVPRSTKAFRQHVERRVARFLQQGHVFYRSFDPPIRLTQEQVASSYDTLYVATYNELLRVDKVNPGDKVNWLQQHRGGYGYTTPVAGIVTGETTKKVRIAVYNLRTQQIEEKLVHPASLTPRTNRTELDDAMEQARRDAAPYLKASYIERRAKELATPRDIEEIVRNRRMAQAQELIAYAIEQRLKEIRKMLPEERQYLDLPSDLMGATFSILWRRAYVESEIESLIPVRREMIEQALLAVR